jgi:hypothetical protein
VISRAVEWALRTWSGACELYCWLRDLDRHEARVPTPEVPRVSAALNQPLVTRWEVVDHAGPVPVLELHFSDRSRLRFLMLPDGLEPAPPTCRRPEPTRPA